MWKDVPPAWTAANGPENDIVISTRARLARNLAGAPFPGHAADNDLEDVAEKVLAAVDKTRYFFTGLEIVDLATASEEDRSYLVDAHLASPQQARPKKGGLVLLEPGGRIAIMVNEEDHLRIQAILPGLQTLETWRLVDRLDDELARSLQFAFTGRLGYLTASLTNLGTGLRVSAMMHLAGLAMTGRLTKTLKAAIELGVSVRGLFGEGSKGIGDLFQVSNEVTLGAPEREFAERVRGVTMHLVEEERRAREDIYSSERGRLVKIAKQSVARLKGAETVAAGEALVLLSPIRFAVAMGAVKGLAAKDLNELLVALRVMRLEKPGEYESLKLDRQRAVLVRRRLKGVEI